MNRLVIIGNVTKEPSFRVLDNGKNVCDFNVAVNRRSKSDHPEADFFKVTTWDGLAEICGRYLSKGKKVAVVGSVKASAYTGQDGEPRARLEIVANEIELLSKREDHESESDGEYEQG